MHNKNSETNEESEYSKLKRENIKLKSENVLLKKQLELIKNECLKTFENYIV